MMDIDPDDIQPQLEQRHRDAMLDLILARGVSWMARRVSKAEWFELRGITTPAR